jgi:hypothetical protein
MINAKILCNQFFLYIQDINKVIWEDTTDYRGEPINTITITDIEHIDDNNSNKINIFTLYKRKFGQKVVSMKNGAIAGWNSKFTGNGKPLNIEIIFLDTDPYNLEVNINVNYTGECIKVILSVDEYGEVTYKSTSYECDSKTVCKAIAYIVENIRNRIEYIIQDELDCL